MKSFVMASLFVGSMLVAACGSDGPFSGRSCTLVGCEQNAKVNFSFRDPGAYVFEVTVDGVKAICRETLPLSQSTPCDRSDVLLARVGSALPANQQSIDGLILQTTTAKTVVVRVTRDGTLIGEKTIALSWTVTPGPNGPDCEPKECRSATATFP